MKSNHTKDEDPLWSYLRAPNQKVITDTDVPEVRLPEAESKLKCFYLTRRPISSFFFRELAQLRGHSARVCHTILNHLYPRVSCPQSRSCLGGSSRHSIRENFH
ncbi:unnamed protein product [Ceratitis capitata]|uniref:(Mediterranean fruit fly) hypothetical protein n=1 Tax=Ceratitis capitata TaxID=7213 RepID=A0A811VIM0_CERCA|nr:unnamed protein product [Ceratitis capitata]